MAPSCEVTRPGQGIERVREHLLTSLILGRLRSGDRVASIRRLAGITGLNRKTIHRAYVALVKEGILDARPGAGTFVARPSGPRGNQEALTRAVNLCRSEATALGLSATAFADFVQGALNGGLKGLPLVVAECNREQIEIIRRNVETGLGVKVRPVLFQDLAADPAAALAGAWGVVTTYCDLSEVESAVRSVGLPVYRVALDPEFPHAIVRWAKSRGVIMVVGDERFGDVFLRILGQLGAPPDIASRVRIVLPGRLRQALREAGDDAVVLVSPLVLEEVGARIPASARPLTSHWRLTAGTLDRLRAELAYDLAARSMGAHPRGGRPQNPT